MVVTTEEEFFKPLTFCGVDSSQGFYKEVVADFVAEILFSYFLLEAHPHNPGIMQKRRNRVSGTKTRSPPI